ncbi:MAG: hypothetical protein KJ077_20700 [Anaerolineae bacterium]|nr:hypothetical protein [Anaerolineae bacterium]
MDQMDSLNKLSRPRIYADFNGLQRSPRNLSRLAVPLDTYGTLRELANAGIRLHDNLAMIIYDYSDDEEDLEGYVLVYWDQLSNSWMAELDRQGVLYTPKKERIQSNEFLCFTCRIPLQDFFAENRYQEDATCPTCGELIITPILPPG